MDGRFSQDMTGAMGLMAGLASGMASAAGLPAPAAGFIPSDTWHDAPQKGLFHAVPLARMAQASQGLGQNDMATPAARSDPRGSDPRGSDLGGDERPPDSPAPATHATPQQNPAPQPVPQPTMQADRMADLRAEIRAELRAELRSEMVAELEVERAAIAATAHSLAAALEQISNPPAAEMSALAQQLGQAVARLASDRAGQAIDTDAAPFARRIAQLAQRVSDKMNAATLWLHPEDRAAIASVLQKACPPDLAELAQARLQADHDLMRGDVRLRLSDARASVLRLDDLIAPHNPPEKQAHHHG